MNEHRAGRFVVEVVFLLALAGVLAFASVQPLVIVGVMAVGWLLVATVEWAVWRAQPHFGSGLPPRYYVPRMNLPPPQVLEQVRAGYPESHRDEAPTWVASAALRAEVLGEWPSAPEAPPEQLPVIEAVPVAAEVVELREPEPEPEVVAVAAEVVELREPEPEPDAGAVKLPPVRLEQFPDRPRARYSFDPLVEQAPKRRFGRRREPDVPELEVPARPVARGLPGAASDR
jgi:hypothetical protein